MTLLYLSSVLPISYSKVSVIQYSTLTAGKTFHCSQKLPLAHPGSRMKLNVTFDDKHTKASIKSRATTQMFTLHSSGKTFVLQIINDTNTGPCLQQMTN